MIEPSGHSVRDPETGRGHIAIKFTGLRLGEKLYEELLIEDDSLRATPHPKIMRAKETRLSETVDFVGEYIDRGPHSAGVLGRQRDWQEIAPQKVICLKGNHEKMMCDFLDDPLGRGTRWLIFGGLDTPASFGINVPDDREDGDHERAAEGLAAAKPRDLRDRLNGLPLT